MKNEVWLEGEMKGRRLSKIELEILRRALRWELILMVCLHQAQACVPAFFASRIDGLLLGDS